VVTLAVLALTLTACGSKKSSGGGGSGSAGTTSGGTTAGKAFNACMVLDTGGVDDKSFNQSSYAGMTAANKANPNLKISYVPSNSQNDYTPNLNAEVAKGCDTTIAVGGLMFDAVTAVAKKNPTKQFAEVDAGSTGPNVYGLQFNTAQGGFLGGYLAAGMTKTGKVATFGGLNIPPVTIYMDGFWEGVQYYNTQKHKSVQVLGWDEKNQKGGTFAQSFTNLKRGQADQPDLHPAGCRHHLPGCRWHRPGCRRGSAVLRRQGQRDLGRHRRLRVGGASTASSSSAA